jgi:hypothetical protein
MAYGHVLLKTAVLKLGLGGKCLRKETLEDLAKDRVLVGDRR